MQSVVIAWLGRILGYGAAAAAPWVADKTGDDNLANWVGSGVAIVGGIILNKAVPYIFPTKKKLDQNAGVLRR